MSAKKISQWISGLGRTAHELISTGVVKNEAFLPSPREGSAEDLISKPIPGIELWFGAKTMRLERVIVTLKGRLETIKTYKGDLPLPFTSDMTQLTIREKLGEPYQVGNPVKMPLYIGFTGGWDAYRLHSSIHPNAEIAIQYLADKTVCGLAFCLLDPDQRQIT